MRGNLTGLIAAPHTPLLADGELNLAMVERLAEQLVVNGVRGAFVCGTTGEGHSLTVPERLAVAERWKEIADETLPVIVHVGANCLKDAQALAAHAQRIGAYAIATLAPCFFKPGLDELIAYCAEVAAAAPELPFYFYHIPAMTGVNVSVTTFLERAGERIPNLAGVKYTNENLMDFGLCLTQDDGHYNMLFGRDEILLSGLALGAKGAVGSTYNYAAPIYQRLIAAFSAGDLATAQQEQAHARAVVQVLQQYGGLVAGKAIMKLIGLDCGPVRLPLRNLSEDEFAGLRTALENMDFFNLCTK